MWGLLRADMIVLFKRKLFWVMMLILLVMVALTAGIFFLGPQFMPDQMEAFPTIEKPMAYSFGAGQVVDQTWFPLILAVVVLGGEMGSSIWASQLTRESRRWRHLLSKLTVTTVSVWLATILGIALFGVLVFFFAEGSGNLAASEWFAICWKALPIVFIWTALGFGFAGALRAVGPAIGAGIGFMFLDGILILWRPWQNMSVSIASQRVFGDFSSLTSDFGFSFGSMTFTHAVVCLVIWAILGTLLAWIGIGVRDP